ncbi:tetratricopeptide repeat protein [Shewanella gelidii]|uniref:Protein SirB1 N-terminal domain-containing protein n=1 Tax=Shewanella gelidii TaxID=1642821 RepID=A0A917JM22_9GAMM|nr:tetratricopeptide repeat protein [Shewanella gelidii]MCL1097081.1 tetratricopeptide repeat protein [Shewanella gelidii]GGI72429.1 hypothetical protein GCM10009332_07280 [Shewanella gelidii]
MHNFTSKTDLVLPELALEVSEHLGFSNKETANWSWLELAGSVLSHYVVDQEQRLQALLTWFYRDLGFCAKQDYFSVEAADLSTCLVSRQGNSTTLATLLLLLAKQLDLPLEVLLIPGHTVICSRISGVAKYIDPLNGNPLTRHQIHVFIRGELGNAARLKVKYFKPASIKQIQSRMLHEMKAGCIIGHKFEQAMECCNLLLQWHEDDVHLNRERAFIAQQLGCIKVAADDLKHFVDNSPHDPVTELVKIQLRELDENSETYH